MRGCPQERHRGLGISPKEETATGGTALGKGSPVGRRRSTFSADVYREEV